ncbi:glycosyltransferase family 4 protein [Mesorhizobium sp. M0179]|uniref:glycosyltransferase n=1 Tax=unclassified Mesorhizobium TaxID=325217 RepID=UPI0003CF2864|nr:MULTISPECIES: glycosyltransferase family 4 protein [unclassified Mesorhizobium]ESX11310.1 hypothetical protein X768_11945 [Mesorhizobium sp. LSJC265A00]ESZ04430.1 hypothetical protein X736_22205 [Mesorhizobium sp. L2C089B000]ESZ32070.1 hypothetical protein X732_29155 [Mesorhizobium sp. L2C066B000]
MRILITNLSLSRNSGSEAVVELLADGLRDAGHQTMLLAPTLGDMADRMRRRGHHVVDRIAEIVERPDVIHAQHLTPCLTALARFPDVPAVFSCHSAFFEVEAPMLHPQIRHWIAVDEACRAKCLSRGIPADQMSLVYNAVDLNRFKQRPPLPARPARGLLLTKNFEHQAAVREACARSGIQLDELGPATGRFSQQLEQDLLGYDIVFATARMAIEAAAVGCSVVVCDARGFAGLLSSANMEAWRRFNLGVGLLTKPTTVENLLGAISGFGANDAAAVSTYFRKAAGDAYFIEEHLRIYDQVLRSDRGLDPDERALATAVWIEEIGVSHPRRRWFHIVKELHGWPDAPELATLLAQSHANSRVLEKLGEQNARTQQLVLDEAVSRAAALGDNPAVLSRVEEQLSNLSNFVDEIKRLYNGMIPLFIRKLLLRARKGAGH